MAVDREWVPRSDSEEDLQSMGSGSGSSSLSLDSAPPFWKGEAEVVSTSYGPIQVNICGERAKPGLITYHDVGLNHSACFRGLFLRADISSLLLHNFCVYHIDAPGHEAGAPPIPGGCPHLSADDLADQVAEVAAHYSLARVVCLGVSAGAYVLTLFAVNHPDLVAGLVLVSPVWRPPSLAEWCATKLAVALLSLCGMTRYVKDALLLRYFGQEASPPAAAARGPGSHAARAIEKDLGERVPVNVARYLQAMQGRVDLSDSVARLECAALIVTGEDSPFLDESTAMGEAMDSHLTTQAKVRACGSLVTAERPREMLAPLELFLLGLGYGCPTRTPPGGGELPRSPFFSCPVSPHLTPEAMSPQGLGLKLKPIRTRVGAGRPRHKVALQDEREAREQVMEDMAHWW